MNLWELGESKILSCNKDRLQKNVEIFSQFGKLEGGGVTRLSLSEADYQARVEFCSRCKALNMAMSYDDLGNIYGTLPGKKDLPAISLGSHMDSVIEGGNFDGILGVLTALEVVETIVENNIEMNHPLTIIDFTNEEGADFEPAMMCSGIIAGKFQKETMLLVENRAGKTFGEALKESGFFGDFDNRLKNIGSYIELHIEQGPILENAEKQIGVVEGVVGMICYEFQIFGESDHAGTTPMNVRKDALFAATDVIVELRRKLLKLDEELVFTIGRIIAEPNVHTVIPNRVIFSLEARHKKPQEIQKVVKAIEQISDEVMGCRVTREKLWDRNTVEFDRKLVNCVKKSCQDLKLTYKKMYSGAGHDAQFIADIVPTTMIFVPSINGKSHCQIEKTEYEDCLNGANVMLQTVLQYDQ